MVQAVLKMGLGFESCFSRFNEHSEVFGLINMYLSKVIITYLSVPLFILVQREAVAFATFVCTTPTETLLIRCKF